MTRLRRHLNLILAITFFVLDVLFIHVAKYRYKRTTAPLPFLLTWLILEASVCVVAGWLQVRKAAPFREDIKVAAIAAAALAVAVLVTVNSNSGSQDCPGKSPCDTAYGLGATLIFAGTVPIFLTPTSLTRIVKRLAHRNPGR